MFCVSMYEPCGLCARCRVRNCLQVLIKFSLIYCTRAGPGTQHRVVILHSCSGLHNIYVSAPAYWGYQETKTIQIQMCCSLQMFVASNSEHSSCVVLGWAGLGWPGMQFSFLKLELSEERLGPGLGAGANLPPNFPLSSQTFHDTLAPDN